MTSLYITLFIEFFKTGLFAVGGGLATVPFLMQMARAFPDWFSASDVGDMLAVAQILPGAIGVNLAAYAGLAARGGGVAAIGTALLAAFSLVLPSIIIITIVSRFFEQFKTNEYVRAVFRTLRPAALGLLAAAGFGIWKISFWKAAAAEPVAWYTSFQWKEIALFALFTFAVIRFKKHPALYIGAGALAGIVLGL